MGMLENIKDFVQDVKDDPKTALGVLGGSLASLTFAGCGDTDAKIDELTKQNKGVKGDTALVVESEEYGQKPILKEQQQSPAVDKNEIDLKNNVISASYISLAKPGLKKRETTAGSTKEVETPLEKITDLEARVAELVKENAGLNNNFKTGAEAFRAAEFLADKPDKLEFYFKEVHKITSPDQALNKANRDLKDLPEVSIERKPLIAGGVAAHLAIQTIYNDYLRSQGKFDATLEASYRKTANSFLELARGIPEVKVKVPN